MPGESALLKDVIPVLEALAPSCLAEEWDNVGLQIGDPRSVVRAVAVALDPSPWVVDAVCRSGFDLLVTHHPMFFRPLKKIDLQTGIGRSIGQALRHGLAVFSLHTNLDAVAQGLNDWLAVRLGLERIRLLSSNRAVGPKARHGIGRVGDLSRTIRLKQLALAVKKKLGIETLRIAGDPGLKVRKAALSTGSGGGMVPDFLASGAQVFISGDLRYHEAREIESAGLGLIDVGHFHSEHLMKDAVVKKMKSAFAKRRLAIAVTAVAEEKDPFTFL
jgi:dinuclear metal center YbgI/SA1388 family protein